MSTGSAATVAERSPPPSCHVEQNRKTMLRMNAAERGVKGHLPDGDTHASCTLVAEPQDSLTIAHHDAFHAVVRGMTQDLMDTIFIRIAEEQASWFSPYLTEALAALAHSGRVDQRKHLFDMAQQERIEQRLVRILQVSEKTVFIKGVRLIPQCLNPALNLFLKTPHMRWQ